MKEKEMKAIINGTRYDTEHATEVGRHEFSNRGDFNYWSATLYMTPRSGRFFLAGSGGPMSRYSETIGQNEWSGGSRIDPLTEAQAFEWAQRYLGTDEVEKYFADLIEEA